MEPNSNLSPQVTHQPSLLGGAENMKLLFDDTMSDMSASRKMAARHADAWETLRFRIASNGAAYDHAVSMGSVLAAQAGTTEGQQTVSPARTAASDNLAAGIAPANRAIDVATAGVATAAEGIATANQSIADAVANLMNALTAVIVTATGGASTPSQTKPPTTA